MMTLAELNMDAAVHASPAQASASSPEDTARSRYLQMCASWLALIQEADLLGPAWAEGKDATAVLRQRCSNPDSGQRVEETSQLGPMSNLQAQLASRFSWTSGRLADQRQDQQGAIVHFNNALLALHSLGHESASNTSEKAMQSSTLCGSSTVMQDQEGAVSISLQHCQQDAVISSSSILAKLQVLKLAETRQEASSLLEAGASTEALAVLEQELLQDPAFAAKASQHDATGFVKSLELLLVSARTISMLLAAIKVGSLSMAATLADGAGLTRCMSQRNCSC